jgi:hypothetical protein
MERTYSRVVYAALGDSMSIDDYAGGLGRGAASLLWRNRDHDFPAWAGHDLTTHDPTARLVLLASDGAISTMVAGEQLGRLRRLGVIPTLATVTMGGNDLLAAYGDATAARRAIKTVADNGRRLLASLRDLMGPAAPIMVATVYDPAMAAGTLTGLVCRPGRRRWRCWPSSTGRCGHWPQITERWWWTCMPASWAMAWPLVIPPSRPRARMTVACGTAA